MSALNAELHLSAVVLALTGDAPRVLVVGPDGDDMQAALPSGPLDLEHDRTLDLGLRRLVGEQTGLVLGYVEQLYTFGDLRRDRAALAEGRRPVGIAYLALVREQPDVRWEDVYAFLPWEDRRRGTPPAVAANIAPALSEWAGADPERRERADIAFGLGGSAWDDERVLERYELLYEVGLSAERARDRGEPALRPGVGLPMAHDHRRILATALGRVRGKIRYRPVVFELLPPTFTLPQLQRVVEALEGVRLHTANFRRVVERAGLVEGTGTRVAGTGGRPAELFRFRREVLRERRSPGVGLPGV